MSKWCVCVGGGGGGGVQRTSRDGSIQFVEIYFNVPINMCETKHHCQMRDR